MAQTATTTKIKTKVTPKVVTVSEDDNDDKDKNDVQFCVDVAFDESFSSIGLPYNKVLYHDSQPGRGKGKVFGANTKIKSLQVLQG